MTVYRVTSNPTFRDMSGRFSKAEKALLAARRSELRKLGRLHQQAIQRAAPKKTGEFARGIRFRSFEKGDSVGFTVSTPQPLGKWLRPPGTKPHTITARRAKYLRFYWPKAGKVVFFKSVQHPGYKPDSDFVEDAVDSLADERRAALRRISTRYINEVVR